MGAKKQHIGINLKISLPAALLFLVFLIVSLITLNRVMSDIEYSFSDISSSLIIESYKNELKNTTELAAGIVQTVFSRDDLTREQKLELAEQMINPLRFGEDGYFYAYQNGTGINIYHGLAPANQGRNLWDLQSPDGSQYIIRDLDRGS